LEREIAKRRETQCKVQENFSLGTCASICLQPEYRDAYNAMGQSCAKVSSSLPNYSRHDDWDKARIEMYQKEKSQFSTWLFTIAKNLSLQDKKLENRNISLDIEFDDEGTTLKDFIQETESNEFVHDVFAQKADVMKKHISDLKEPYKTVIIMREIERMQYKDIADKLGKNLSTIKSQIRNGRQILMEQSKKEFDQIDEMYLD
jgi:RNA polymerase sigma factor (sigma-70 family)